MSGPAGQLLRGHRGAPHDRCDLVEGHPEQVVQDERDPLGRRERVQHHEQRPPHRFRQQGLVFGVAAVPGRPAQLGELLPDRVLRAGRAGAQYVEAHP